MTFITFLIFVVVGNVVPHSGSYSLGADVFTNTVPETQCERRVLIARDISFYVATLILAE